MGSNVQFIAFREAPDIEKLSAIAGLTGFRLFKHAAKPEWYLEGPNPDGDDITFYQPLDYAPKGDASEHGLAGAKALAAAIKSAGIKAYGLDEKTVAAALALSIEIGIATLLIYSNDDGIDAGFVCEAGRAIYVRLPTLLREVVVFENGAVRAEAPSTDEFDDGEPVLDLHHFASEAANAFFGTSIRWRVTSDPYEFEAADYTLLAAHGQRAPTRIPGDDTKDALWAIESSETTDADKLRKCLALMDTHVVAALDIRLLAAPRIDVDYADFQILACAVHADRRRYTDAAYATLSGYFHALAQYLRRLKPKPDFRHDMDFGAEGRRLLAEWQTIKRKPGA